MMMDSNRLKSNRAFIERSKSRYPHQVLQTSVGTIRPQAVENGLGHTRMARVPIDRTVVWMFETESDARKFKERFL